MLKIIFKVVCIIILPVWIPCCFIAVPIGNIVGQILVDREFHDRTRIDFKEIFKDTIGLAFYPITSLFK
jgi:hypothetical protein